MSEQSRIAFERNVAIREANHIHDADAYFKARPQIDNADRRKVFEAGHCRAWNAATLESAERIAALEGEVAELKDKLTTELKRGGSYKTLVSSLEGRLEHYSAQDYTLAKHRLDALEKSLTSERKINETLTNENTELQASNNNLREALETIATESHYELWQVQVATKAISATPAESLAKHDDEVIERCAKVCEEINKYTQFQTVEDYKLANEAARNIRALKGK